MDGETDSPIAIVCGVSSGVDDVGHPLRRHGTPEEIAKLVAWLLSHRNGDVSGQHLLVEGGLVAAG